jgi:hypothetical protein
MILAQDRFGSRISQLSISMSYPQYGHRNATGFGVYCPLLPCVNDGS